MSGVDTVNDEFEVGLAGAFSGLCTIGLMHIFASWLKEHSAWAGREIDGTPVVVYEHGAFNRRGLMRLAQVRYAVAERDGKISIVQEEAA